MMPLVERRRRIGLAIAGNIEIIGGHILAGWRDGPDSVVKKLDGPAYAQRSDGPDRHRSARPLPIDPGYQTRSTVRQNDRERQAAPCRRLAKRPQHPAIAINLATLRDAANIIFAKSKDEILSPSVLKSSVKIADSLSSENLSALVASPKQRSDAVLLLDAATSARDVCKSEIPHALGITVGFNSLDGD